MTHLPALRICLFGDFTVTYDDEPVSALGVTRLQHLLAYLVLHRHTPQSREHLAYLLWPGSSEASARANLRGVLYRLRSALPQSDLYLHLDTNTAQWNERAPYHLDVAEFEAALSMAGQAERDGRRADMQAALERAVAHYRGPLLPTCYFDWIEPERDRLSHALIEALEKLIAVLETQRDYAAALEYALQLLQQDTLREATYRHLMRLHALNDDRPSALRIYHACKALLRRELDIEPSAATREVYDQLLQADAAAATGPEAARPDLGLPLVGREIEWEALQGAWRIALRGSPHCAVLLGEAGIGKTRLAEEMIRWARLQGMTRALARCYASGESVAYVPVVDWLRAPAMRASVASAGLAARREIARLLPEIGESGLPEAEPLPVPQQRQRLFDALATVVLRAPQPIVLVLDDAQWCDRETVAWLRHLLHWPLRSRLLLLVTARVEELDETHPLRELMRDLHRTGQMTEIGLGPLGAMETATLAAQLAGRALTHQQADTLYQETEGNPLFVVEAVQNALDASSAQDGSLPLRRSSSPTVQAVIARRLAALSPSARELTCLAATIGREFTLPVLQLASDRDAALVTRDLDELWRKHLIRVAPSAHAAASDVYDFTHDKIREAAYASSSPMRRRLLHLQVALALERASVRDQDNVSALIATHYEHAAMPELAVPHLLQAAANARRVWANEAAIAHLQRALDLIGALPESDKTAGMELETLRAMMAPMIASRGYAADEVGRAKLRAWELVQRIGNPEDVAVLAGEIWNYHAVRGDWTAAQAYGREFIRTAEDSGNAAIITEARRSLDETLLFIGEFDALRTGVAWERVTADASGQRLVLDGALLETTSPLFLLCFAARLLWYRGQLAQAVQRIGEALAMAERMPDPSQLALALSTASQLHLVRGDLHTSHDCVERMLGIAEKRGYAYFTAGGVCFRGWLTANFHGRVEEGIAQIRVGLAQWRQTGAGLWLPYLLGLLADTHLRARQAQDGLTVVAEALSLSAANRDRFWEPELLRLQGELTWASVEADVPSASVLAEVERSFQNALALARQQRAHTLVLRSTVSLARLWALHSNASAARDLLTDVYGQFSEGFDAADLVAARALLNQLERASPSSSIAQTRA